MHIKVIWTTDTYNCETCGLSVAYGCKIYFDESLVYELEPKAHCFGGDSITEEEVWKKTLELLGHTVDDWYN